MNLKIYRYLAGLLFLGLMHQVKAQDGIDTALFKGYGVKKMYAYVKLPILPTKGLHDSCMVEIYEFDTLERITYQKNDVGCYGWSGATENFNDYDSLSRLSHSKLLTSGNETHIYYTYNKHNDAIKIRQKNIQANDSFITLNKYSYNKVGKIDTVFITNITIGDTSRFVLKYEYDTAFNVNVIWTYTGDMKLIQKQTFDITPRSRKLLEFSTEVILPQRSFTRGWNYYNFDAQLSRTQYSNNTWTEFVYFDNGLLDQTLSYNMQGKLNAWKTYYYEFHDRK